MALNATKKRKITEFYTAQKATLLLGTHIKSGAARGDDAKDANFRQIKSDLVELDVYSIAADVTEAAGLLGEVIGRVVEVQAPPADNGAARKLVQLNRDSSTVQHMIAGVDVRLDIDQLKHQHASHPIGTRHKGGGHRFNNQCDATWHQTVTMAYMASWANQLGAMNPGDQKYHGQMVPVNNVHYEGFCLFSGGQKYILFHCYPASTSPMRGPNG